MSKEDEILEELKQIRKALESDFEKSKTKGLWEETIDFIRK